MKLTRFLLVVSFAWAAQAPAQDIDGSITHTSQTITIDGNDDEAVWAEATAYNDFFHAASNPPDDDADLSTTWRALWDDENLYFFVEVTDDAHVVGDSNDWQDDSIELYLDADGLGKDEGPTIQDYATDLSFPVYQLTILAGEIELHNGINHANWIIANDDVADMNAAAPVDGTNYAFEIAIPWSTLGESTPEDIIDRGFFGLGLAVNDDDDEGERDSQIMWATDNGELWHDATVFPNVELLFPDLPGPEIFVKKNVDHGQISAEQAVHDFVLPVRNWGQENALTISGVTVTGPDADLVTVGEFSSVAANSIGELPYSLDTAGRTGAFDFTLVIESDDVDPDDQTKMTRVTAAVINFAGPAIHYAMDDGAEATELRDITGYNRHGMLDGGASLDGEGLAGGGSLSVSGGSQGVIPGNHLGTMRSFSVSMWAQPSATVDLQTLFGHGVGTPTFAILLQDGDLTWFAGDAPEFNAPGVITAGTPYHVVATFNNAAGERQVVLYLDGQPVATQDDPTDVLPDPLDNYFVGAFDGALPFAGLIDDVQIYDRVLSGEEVEFLFANPGEPWSGNVDVAPDADAVVLGTDAEAGFVAAGSAAGSAGLLGSYWNLEPKAVPTTDEPMHRSGDGGANSGWVDENVYATETTGTFVASAFEYTGNDLTLISEWLGADAGSFTGTEDDLDDGVFRFQGYLHAPVAGNQEITFTSDDGSVLYVGNQLVINNDNGHGDTEVSGKVFFPEAGFYPVDIRYFNGDWLDDAGENHGGANFIAAGLDNAVQWAGTAPPPTGDILYANDFTFADGTTDLGDGSIIASNDGTNSVQAGALRMTQAGTNDTTASFILPPFDASAGWSASFDFVVEHTGENTPADGFSFNYGAIPEEENFGAPAEEGYGDATPHVSFQVDSWLWNDAAAQDAGVGIELTGTELVLTKATDDNANFMPNERVEASATLSWDPENGASFSTTGLRTNADFTNIPTDGFSPEAGYGFSFLARTGGHNETLLIDNLVIRPLGGGDGGGEGIPGLLGYWRLDGNAEDASGQGVDGNVISPDGVWINDPERGAVYQSGNGSFIELGTLPVIGVDTDFTWSFWVNSDETDNNNIVFGNRWAPDGTDFDPREFIKFTPRTFEWHFTGIGENIPLDNTMFVVGEWAHNLVVKSGANLTYYRDGVEVASGTITGAPVNAQPLYLGGQNGAENFSGRLDEVAIFDRALSADEVAEVYGRGLAGESLSGGDPIDPGGDGRLPSLTDVGFTVDGFGVTIPGDQTVDIQFSLDLIDWDIIATGVTGAFEDTDATRTSAGAGYYRASQE